MNRIEPQIIHLQELRFFLIDTTIVRKGSQHAFKTELLNSPGWAIEKISNARFSQQFNKKNFFKKNLISSIKWR